MIATLFEPIGSPFSPLQVAQSLSCLKGDDSIAIAYHHLVGLFREEEVSFARRHSYQRECCYLR